jgi:ribosomal-protein-alanine N-acetyltransferase
MDKVIGLEVLSITDSAKVFELYSNRIVLQNYQHRPIANKSQTKDFIRRITTNGCWSWKIISNDKNKTLLGICSLHHFDQSEKSIEIGGTLFPEFWGQGIMQNAFNELLEIAKIDFGVRKVLGKTLPTNQQAIKMVRKLGFEILKDDAQEIILIRYINKKNTSV